MRGMKLRGFNMAVPLTGSGMTGTAQRLLTLLLPACVLTCGLAGCGMVDAVFDGFKHAKAVEADLAVTAGIKPAVGFNWRNGRLTSVTVTFPQLMEDKPLREIAEAARAAVGKEFKQRADNVVLAFSLGPTATSTAQAGEPQSMN